MPCHQTICALKTPSCSNGSTDIHSSLILLAKPPSLFWMSIRRRKSPKLGTVKNLIFGRPFNFTQIYWLDKFYSLTTTNFNAFSLCSFLDDSFRKNLESALRFGNPLLVQVFYHFCYSHLFLQLLCLIFNIFFMKQFFSGCWKLWPYFESSLE